MIFIAIDPGTGLKSACGIAILKSSSVGVELLQLKDLWTRTPQPNALMRIRDIVDQIEDIYTEWYDKENGNIAVAIESFVMRGKGGESLQRFIGAALTRVPSPKVPIIEVANTKMKKFVGGSGASDKEAILKKVLIKFPANQALIMAGVRKEYDAIDAVGIGLTAIDIYSKMEIYETNN